MDKKKLATFLTEARANTYAGGKGKVKPAFSGSIQLEYREGGWLYRDVSNTGNKIFVGLETVYLENQPVWSMCYYGDFKKMTEKDQSASNWEAIKETIVFSSGKPLTADKGLELLGLPNARQYNPEAPGTTDYQQEPDGHPFKAVEFKLRRVHQLFPKHLKEEDREKLYTYLASDVGFSILRSDGKHIKEIFHKPIRKTKGKHALDHEATKQELAQRYSKDFKARWRIGMGAAVAVAKDQRISMGMVTIEADFEPLTRAEIDEFYEPESNAGVDMVGIGIRRELSFWLYLSPGGEPILCNTPELRKLAGQLIVDKMPTKEMILALYETEIETHPQRYAPVVFAKAHLLTQPQ